MAKALTHDPQDAIACFNGYPPLAPGDRFGLGIDPTGVLDNPTVIHGLLPIQLLLVHPTADDAFTFSSAIFPLPVGAGTSFPQPLFSYCLWMMTPAAIW